MDTTKPGVQKVTNMQKRADGAWDAQAADGSTITLPNTFSPQIAAGTSDGYVIVESNGNMQWMPTAEYETRQKQQQQQADQQAQQAQQSAMANQNVNSANVDVDRDQDVIKSEAPSKRSR